MTAPIRRTAQVFPDGRGTYRVDMYDGSRLKHTVWVKGRKDAEREARAWEGR